MSGKPSTFKPDPARVESRKRLEPLHRTDRFRAMFGLPPLPETMKVKIIYRRNLRMSPGKLAAQAVHAAVALKVTDNSLPVVVLECSDKKFYELVEQNDAVTVEDAGYTEVEPGTTTCAAFYEATPL